MKKIVANPMELRDAVRCEKKAISLTGGFAKMMAPIVAHEAEVDTLALPTFVKLALDPATMNKLATAYHVAASQNSGDLELEYVKV